jgi:hypothetical protein
MTDPADRSPRRAFLGALACGSAVAPGLWAQPAIGYSMLVQPARAMLGDPVVAQLRCVASREGAEAFTFEDASLELELQRLPPGPEPALVFPNREVRQSGSLQIHARADGRKRLRSGERLSREVQLIAIYPRWILDTGNFQISYRIGPEGRSWRTTPANLTVESGPAAIPALFALLDHADTGVRARASGLLHRMTAYIAGFGAESDQSDRQEAIAQWRGWWQATGSKMPWNFLSAGATFAGKPAPPARSGRSKFLGGIAYERQALDATGVKAMSSALGEWLRNPSAGPAALMGSRWIADLAFKYPGEDVMLDPGGDVARMLASALSQLPERSPSAPIILGTIARMPDGRYIGLLASLESLTLKVAGRGRPGLLASGLLDLLDPGRTPTGPG